MAREHTEKSEVLNALLDSNARLSLSDLRDLNEAILRQRDENIARQTQLEQERISMIEHFDMREKEMSNQIEKTRREYRLRESDLKREIVAREEALRAEEKNLADRFQAMIDDRNDRLSSVERREFELKQSILEFEDKQQRYDVDNNLKLQRVSADFVQQVVRDLKIRESSFGNTSFWWSVGGGVALALGLSASSYSFYQTSVKMAEGLSWPSLTFLSIKGAILLTIVGVFARYAFLMSKRYMQESLKVSNIIHDVSFGQLYVQSYGATAGWDQVKDAFSRWHHVETVGEIKEKEDLEMKADLPQLTALLNAVKGLRG